MINLPELKKYQEFVSNLELIDDEDMRFEYIIDVGKKGNQDEFPEEMKIDSNLMHGCMSKVWIIDQVQDGRHYFLGYSDAIIVKGLVILMTESFNGLTGEELQLLNEDHVRYLNLGALTTQRQVGMLAMLMHFQRLGSSEGSSVISAVD